MADLKVENVTKLLKDALYLTVGLGVITFQKAQVQRRELQKRLDIQFGDARSQLKGLVRKVDDRVKVVEERLEGVEARVDALLDQVENRLPKPAQGVTRQARAVAKDARHQVRTLVGNGSR
jgi:hypothetical protein